MMTSKRSIIALGEDMIEREAWDQPICDYQGIFDALGFAEEHSINIPIEELHRQIPATGPIHTHRLSERSEDFFEWLLYPYVTVNCKHFDADMPGRSGIFKTVFLDKAGGTEISRRLEIAERILTAWGKHHETKYATSTPASFQSEVASTDATESSRAADRAREWETEISNAIVAHLNSGRSDPFCSFHFLAHKGVVYFLKREGWWHSIGGNKAVVVSELLKRDIEVVPVNILKCTESWIPYFARSTNEEPGLGWNDPYLEIEPENAEWSYRMSAAWTQWKSRNGGA